MQVEVRCPKCNHKYLLDEAAVPATGAKLTCKSCGYKWEAHDVDGATAEPAQATPARAASGPPPAPPLAAATPPAARAPTLAAAPLAAAGPPPAPHLAAATPLAAAGAAGQSLITCPGCGLKFVAPNAAAGGAAGPPPAASASMPKAGAETQPARARGAAGPSPVPAGPKGSAKTILVAEDVEYFAALARTALEKKYRTLTVASVADALRVIGSEPIDLLILDLTLQGEDGRQVLRSLSGKRFPVLIFTARDENDMYGEVWKELQSLGADDMLIKGMNVEETLLQKVGILLTKP